MQPAAWPGGVRAALRRSGWRAWSTALAYARAPTEPRCPGLLALAPPAANVTLSFSFPVVLSLLQSALKLASCCKRSDAAGRSVRVLPCGPPYVAANPFAPRADDPMAANATCAVVQVVPGLGAGQVVALQLPAGASYSPLAGRARKTAEVFLWGLRRFRVPLRDNFQQLKNASEDFEYDVSVCGRGQGSSRV